MNPSQHDQNQESKQISTWAHRAWFGGGCAAALFSIAKSLKLFSDAPTSSWPWFTSTITAFAAYVAADLGTGIYHWSIDNYGSPKTPFFGSQIEGFLGHHQRPWVITKVQVAYNLHHAAAPVAVILFPISVLSGDPIMLMFLGVFGSSVIFNQQFHAWSHNPKGQLPAVVVALQDVGIILRRGGSRGTPLAAV
ncbi:hypothetical protein ACS0TY_016725 [Phlomoides rotata]